MAQAAPGQFPRRQPDRDAVVGMLSRFGSNSLSFLLLYEAPWRWFFGRSVEGAIPYIDSSGSAVVWADPLCAQEDVRTLLEEFESGSRFRRVCLVAVGEATARQAMSLGYAALKVGEEPVFDLETWHEPKGDPGKKLRWCLNHARRAGVRVFEYRPGEGRDQGIEDELRAATRTWESQLGRRKVNSFLRTDPLQEAARKRVFVARRDGPLEAFVSCAPVYGRGGWYLEDLVRTPAAVNGTSELLIVQALDRFREEGYRHATLGMAPLRGSDAQVDRKAAWIARGLSAAFDRFDSRFHFASLSRFKSKFRPSDWEPRFVVFRPPRPSIGLVRSVISVLDP